MESYNVQKTILVLSFLFFSSYALLVQALSPAGTIQRITKQQVLASIPPSHESTPTGSSQLFLTSPSGKYAVFLLRRETSPGAGGFGTDFCYVQVQDSGISVWESECTVVSNVNTCTLVFSDAGLEIYDGSNSAWDTDVEDDHAHLETLVLIDTGDMRIMDKEGELKWKASDNPIVNQNCGSIGAPGLSPAHPPFGSPIHGRKGPFGQQVNNQVQQVNNQGQQPPFGIPQQQQPQEQELAPEPEPQPQPQPPQPQPQPQPQQQQQLGFSQQSLNQPFSSLNQPFGVGNQQPLVDNTPFDSGCSRVIKLEMGLVCLVGLMGYFGFLF